MVALHVGLLVYDSLTLSESERENEIFSMNSCGSDVAFAFAFTFPPI